MQGRASVLFLKTKQDFCTACFSATFLNLLCAIFLAMALELVVLGIVAVIVLLLVFLYNGLVVNRNRAKNAWSQIDVQLKRRADLIPNIVETVKGYAKHEKGVFTKVTEARSAIMRAGSVKEAADANNMLTSALKSLFAVAENYPQLQASQNFLQLQEELSGTESKIAFARQFYNDSVLEFNNAVQTFPSSIIAGMFAFTLIDYFETEEAARTAPKVSF